MVYNQDDTNPIQIGTKFLVKVNLGCRRAALRPKMLVSKEFMSLVMRAYTPSKKKVMLYIEMTLNLKVHYKQKNKIVRN